MSYEEAKARALRYLEKRDYGRDELAEKLRQKGESEEDASRAAGRMEELGLINDERYAAQVVRHYAGKGYGRSRVREELYRRRLPRELWDDALSDMPETDETLERLLRQKLRGGVDDREALKKAADALARRGFSWSEIQSAVERLRLEEP